MPAAVINFERFCADREGQRGRNVTDVAEPVTSVWFPGRPASTPLSARQIAHRRAMFDYGTERRRTLRGSFTAVVTGRE